MPWGQPAPWSDRLGRCRARVVEGPERAERDRQCGRLFWFMGWCHRLDRLSLDAVLAVMPRATVL